jgi:2-polyprenyl-3-methyl-5-hydroxy-6-metoxy-1,4-benzoquinol methylase
MLDYSIYYRHFHDASKQHYEDMTQFYHRLLANSLRAFPPEAKILDIGCGQGLLVYALKSFGYKNVQGVDLSEQQISIGRQYGLSCQVIDKDYVSNLSRQSPSSFNLIFMLDVLEHMDKKEQLEVLDSISKLLAPGGRLLLSVPNANASFGLRWRYNDWTHEAAFTEHSIEFILLNSNFENITFLPYEFRIRPRLAFIPRKAVALWMMQRFFRLMRRLEAVGEMGPDGWKIPLSLNLLVECVKADA